MKKILLITFWFNPIIAIYSQDYSLQEHLDWISDRVQFFDAKVDKKKTKSEAAFTYEFIDNNVYCLYRSMTYDYKSSEAHSSKFAFQLHHIKDIALKEENGQPVLFLTTDEGGIQQYFTDIPEDKRAEKRTTIKVLLEGDQELGELVASRFRKAVNLAQNRLEERF